MNYIYVVGTLIIIGVVVFTAGCTLNRPYRTSDAQYNLPPDQAGQDPSNHAIIEKTPEYSLGFVEFDEEGWFWSTNQVKAVKDMVRDAANVTGSNNAAGIILVVFVHGWKNNAAYNCGNVATFRTALQQLNQAELTQSSESGRPARKLVGVYCGWRGLSAKWEPFKELSIWTRTGTAHKVGGYGAMTELFTELEQLQEQSNGSIRSGGPQTDLIFVGHSLGAAAVYSAVSEFVTRQFVEDLESLKQNRPLKPLKPLGDQVILLNPAFEASRHYNLNWLATTLDKYPEQQRPVLSIFTSQGDWATHYFLPLGQFVATMFERFRDPAQRHATRQSVGWYDPFVTHTLEYRTNSALGGTATNSTYNLATKKHEYHGANGLRASIQNVEKEKQKWVPNGAEPQTYKFDDSILKPRKTFRPGDPFLIVAVDKKIMKDHDDIDNPALINFLREYIQFCHPGTNAASPAKVTRIGEQRRD